MANEILQINRTQPVLVTADQMRPRFSPSRKDFVIVPFRGSRARNLLWLKTPTFSSGSIKTSLRLVRVDIGESN